MTTPSRRALLTLSLAPFLSGCRADPPAEGPPPMPVKIQVAQAVSVDDTSEYVATLRSRGSVAIMPQVEGHITSIFVRSGAHVAAGAALMQIDPVKQQAAVSSQEDTRAAREAALQFARQEFERVRGLQASGIASQQDLDRAKTALDSAQADLSAVQAQVREQQAQLRYYRVTAPAAGVVGDIPVRVGDRVTVGTLLTTVDSPGLMEVYVYVPVERAGGLRLGLPVRIVDSTGNVVAGSHVTFVSPQVDDRTQTVLVKAGLAGSANLRSAQFIRARVVWGSRQTPTVPVLAVSRISGQHFAFVAEEEKGGLVAKQRPIQVGEIVGNDYVVRSGVAPGDRVIVSGTQFLRDGVPVIPQT